MHKARLKPSPGRLKAAVVAALWLLSILYTLSAHAQEACPAIRIDQSPALHASPRWAQEDSYLFYAFEAFCLIKARLNSGTTSPLGLAADTVAYSQSKTQRS